MAKVTSRIELNEAALARLNEAVKRSVVQTADTVRTDLVTSQIMPFRKGNLQNESTFVDDSKKAQGKASIVTSTPYARRLYFHPEYNFNRAHNGKAGGKWYEPYISGSKADFAKKAFAQHLKTNGGL